MSVHVASSTAGLASLRGIRTVKPHWADRPTVVVTLNTASFELRLSNDGYWYVIHSQSPGHVPNASALVGQGFEVGRNPWEWPTGYASRIQQHLNNMGDDYA